MLIQSSMERRAKMVARIETCDCNSIHQDVIDTVKDHMLSDKKIEALANFYKIFSDTTKIKILWALDINEMCVCDLAVLTNMTKSAISHQLRALKEANLVKYRKDGKNVYYSLADTCTRHIIENGILHTINKE